MFQNLAIFKISHAMAMHAADRQAVLSQNMANVDTPGYVARDLPSFQAQFDDITAANGMRETRAGHLGTVQGFGGRAVTRPNESASPNGNAVSVEEEMLKAVDAKQQHDRALAIYKSALGVVRTSLGRG